MEYTCIYFMISLCANNPRKMNHLLHTAWNFYRLSSQPLNFSMQKSKRSKRSKRAGGGGGGGESEQSKRKKNREAVDIFEL